MLPVEIFYHILGYLSNSELVPCRLASKDLCDIVCQLVETKYNLRTIDRYIIISLRNLNMVINCGSLEIEWEMYYPCMILYPRLLDKTSMGQFYYVLKKYQSLYWQRDLFPKEIINLYEITKDSQRFLNLFCLGHPESQFIYE